MSTPQDVDFTAIPVGSPVLDAGGNQVGTFRAVHGGYFELDRPDDPDFWLSRAHVSGFSSDGVRLALGSEDFESHRLHAPGLEPEDEPLDRPRDFVITEQEALEQRERMERELREQRGVMDTDVRTPLPEQEAEPRPG